jgi:hypothetical protein
MKPGGCRLWEEERHNMDREMASRERLGKLEAKVNAPERLDPIVNAETASPHYAPPGRVACSQGQVTPGEV